MAESLLIARMGHRGDGIADRAGHDAFVPGALPGERVTAQAPVGGAPARMQLVRVDEPSPARIAPFCVHFGVCGGCAIQHWREAEYRAWKRQLVVEALAQAGVAAEVDDLVDAHGAGRRRVTLHARRNADGAIRVGFAAAQSHDIVALDACPVLDPALGQALPVARTLAAALASSGNPIDIQITAASEGLDVDIRGSGRLNAAATSALAQIAATHRLTRLTRHGELIVQHRAPTLPMGLARVALPPGGFLQATVAGEEALAARVLAHCAGAKRVADLFCGVGPFALRLATASQVSAMDSDAAAVAALGKAAQTTRGLKPVVAQARDLFRRPLAPDELRGFDAVVFDPPRQGARAQADQLAAARVPRLVAVSCNAATFARDAGILIAGGYRLARVTPIDQFRHTAHVEIVALFER